MLSRLRTALASAAPEIRERVVLREADMRSFSLGRRFDTVLIPFNTFRHLLSQDDQLSCFERVRSHLRRNGRLALDLAGGEIGQGKSGRVSTPPREFPGLRAGQTLRIHHISEDLRDLPGVRQTVVIEGEGGETALRVSHLLRETRVAEMRDLLNSSGLSVDQEWGGFQGEPMTGGGRQVWVARRR